LELKVKGVLVTMSDETALPLGKLGMAESGQPKSSANKPLIKI
jgi:hypothetical protein